MFDVVIQLGAIIAVIIIFFSELNPFKGGKEKIILWLKIIIATIPVVVFTLIFNDKMVDIYNLRTISFTLIFYGIIFIVVEKITKDKFKITSIGEISYLKALFIGVIQILAIIPGTSRSGITIICGMLLGFDRKMAAKFSFFLSIPVMFGASSLKIFEYVTNDFFTNIKLYYCY
jgi:undecaprenyl-diphosphatase